MVHSPLEEYTLIQYIRIIHIIYRELYIKSEAKNKDKLVLLIALGKIFFLVSHKFHTSTTFAQHFYMLSIFHVKQHRFYYITSMIMQIYVISYGAKQAI